ncbi:putative secreted effector protein, partial [Blumeria graminis f. sp. tritici 96224]
MRFYTVALLLQSVSFSAANLAHYQLYDIQDHLKSFRCLDQIFNYHGLESHRLMAYRYLDAGRLTEITIPQIEVKVRNLPHGRKVMYKSSVPGSRYYLYSMRGDDDRKTFQL